MNQKLTFTESFKAGALAAVVAAVVNSILFYIFHAAGIIVDTIFVQPNEPLTVVPVLISSIVPALIATLVFFLLEKYTQNGFKIFRIVSLVLLALSFMNPFMAIQGVTMAYAIALNSMHLIVVGALFYFIGKSQVSKV
jgi:uncharacterized membrane protein